MEIFERLNVNVGSCSLWTEKNKKGEYEKRMKFPILDSSEPDEKKRRSWISYAPRIVKGKDSDGRYYTQYYMRTGYNDEQKNYNNVMVLDLDDMGDVVCLDLKMLADKCCNYIVQNRKGYHYYFKFDDESKRLYPNKINGKNSGYGPFDLLTNGAFVFCPPTKYKCGDNSFSYEFIKSEGKLTEMSKELKDKINSLMAKKVEIKPEIDNKKKNKKTVEQKQKYEIDGDDITLLIKSLKPERSVNFDYWNRALYAFKSEYPKDSKYFQYFSSLHYKDYDKEVVEKYYINAKPRTKEQKGTTMGTLWFWLEEDNKEVFDTLVKKRYGKNCEIDLSDVLEFNIQDFQKLVNEDNKNLKEMYEVIFTQTKSYQYFNKFHLYNTFHGSLYKVDINSVQRYELKRSSFPNVFVGNELFESRYLASRNMRLFEKFVFEPNKKVKSQEHNLFTGFNRNLVEVDESLIEPYLNHVKDILNNNAEEYNYVLNWFSWIYQRPDIRTKVCLVFYSDTNGTGKGLTIEPHRHIMGKYFYKMDDSTDFAKNFNSSFQNKILIQGNEVEARMRDAHNKFKDVMDRTTINIEFKGKEKYTISDYSNYFFTTNNESVFKMEVSDRRIAMFACKEKKMSGDSIKKIIDILNDPIKLDHLFSYFMKRDISNFEPENIPLNNFKIELIKMDLPAYFKMIKEQPDRFIGESYTTEQLYKEAVEYAKTNNMHRSFTLRKLTLDMSKVFNTYYKRKNDKRYYHFTKDLSDNIDHLLNQYIREQAKTNK